MSFAFSHVCYLLLLLVSLSSLSLHFQLIHHFLGAVLHIIYSEGHFHFSQLVLLCACTCTLGGGMSSLPSDNKNKNVSVVDKTITYEHRCFPRKMLYSKKFNTSFPSLPFPSPTLISYMSIISVCGRENYDFTKFSPEDVLVDKPSIQEAINVSPFTLPPF